MTLLPLLLAAHFIGDWIVQTDWQAANKTTSWRAMSAHIAGYHYMLMLALLAAYPLHGNEAALAPWTIWSVSLVTHTFLDRRWPIVRLMQLTGSPEFAKNPAAVIVTDQACHLTILCILAAVFTR